MLLRLLYQSFHRQQRRKLLACAAISLGLTVLTATVAVNNDIGDRMNLELRSLGANLVVRPAVETSGPAASDGPVLRESNLPKMKHIFWAHNILGYAPVLFSTTTLSNGKAEPLIGTYFQKPVNTGDAIFITGVSKTNPWWRVKGNWPADDSDHVLVGADLATSLNLAPGQSLRLQNGTELHVDGILSTGGDEDHAIVAPLAMVQRIAHRPDAVDQVFVSALTKPEDDFARRDPRTMSGPVLERWMCSPYANTIARQIDLAVPGASTQQVRRVAQSEGILLRDVDGLFLMVTIAALLTAMLAVGAAMSAAIMERQQEIGIMRSLGATNSAIALLFALEAIVLALIGGGIGFATGSLLSQQLGMSVFQTVITPRPLLIPFVLLASVAVTLAGSWSAIRRAVRFDPAAVLRSH